MNDQAKRFVEKPRARPNDPRFSSGPCRKHPGWDPSRFDLSHLGRSHRAAAPKARLNQAITRSAELLRLPADWKLGIVPGSDTGAFEMAMWSLLGERPVDALVWESFSNDWASDLKTLDLGPELTIYQADYGALPDVTQVKPAHDLVMVYNGTTSGVRLPNLDWLDASTAREGLTLCDATSAAFAMPLDFKKLDVVTWSWQKVLGGEAAHGMLALSPKAQTRLAAAPPRPLPKLFRLSKNGGLIEGVFRGETINTPSMLAVEDLHSALEWAEGVGLDGLHARSQANFDTLDAWVSESRWADWLAEEPASRSSTSMCLKITSPAFAALDVAEQQRWVKTMTGWLAEEGVAYDIANYRSAPPGFRIWGGATVEADDVRLLTAWLDWAYDSAELQINTNTNTEEARHA